MADTKDYLGIIFPIAIATVGLSLMALVSAEAAGTMHDANVNRIISCGFGLAVALGVTLAILHGVIVFGLAYIPLFMCLSLSSSHLHFVFQVLGRGNTYVFGSRCGNEGRAALAKGPVRDRDALPFATLHCP